MGVVNRDRHLSHDNTRPDVLKLLNVLYQLIHFSVEDVKKYIYSV